jgi:hypothetical protein
MAGVVRVQDLDLETAHGFAAEGLLLFVFFMLRLRVRLPIFDGRGRECTTSSKLPALRRWELIVRLDIVQISIGLDVEPEPLDI